MSVFATKCRLTLLVSHRLCPLTQTMICGGVYIRLYYLPQLVVYSRDASKYVLTSVKMHILKLSNDGRFVGTTVRIDLQPMLGRLFRIKWFLHGQRYRATLIATLFFASSSTITFFKSLAKQYCTRFGNRMKTTVWQLPVRRWTSIPIRQLWFLHPGSELTLAHSLLNGIVCLNFGLQIWLAGRIQLGCGYHLINCFWIFNSLVIILGLCTFTTVRVGFRLMSGCKSTTTILCDWLRGFLHFCDTLRKGMAYSANNNCVDHLGRFLNAGHGRFF